MPEQRKTGWRTTDFSLSWNPFSHSPASIHVSYVHIAKQKHWPYGQPHAFPSLIFSVCVFSLHQRDFCWQGRRQEERKKDANRCLSKGGKVNLGMLILLHNRHCVWAKAVTLTFFSAHMSLLEPPAASPHFLSLQLILVLNLFLLLPGRWLWATGNNNKYKLSLEV